MALVGLLFPPSCGLPSAVAQTFMPEPGKPAWKLRVIDGIEVRRGDKTTVYQRVEPLVLPPRPAATSAPTSGARRQLSAEQLRRAAKKSDMLLLSASVYEHAVTELRWHQQGRAYRAYSNIDFHHLEDLSEIETAGTIYQLIIALDAFTTAEVEAFNSSVSAKGLSAKLRKHIPPPETFTSGRPEYVLVADPADAPIPAEVTAMLDALHNYYEANQQTLADQAAQRAAERTTGAAAARAQPAKPKRTVIQFWRVPDRDNQQAEKQ